jgi:hypothetical protein
MTTTPKSRELFIVDNSVSGWTGLRYLEEWTGIARSFDIATGYFEIGALLALDGKWQGLDKIRILMGAETTQRTRKALLEAVRLRALQMLDGSIEADKAENPFLRGVPAILKALQSGQIECRVYDKDKFHAKAYITHAKLEVVGAQALVGSSNFTAPGLTKNIELNIQVQKASLCSGGHNDDDGAGRRPVPAVAVPGAGIEIQGVPLAKHNVLAVDADQELAFEGIDEFSAFVLVRLRRRRLLGKLGVEAPHPAICDREVEALEEVAGRVIARPVRQAEAVLPADDRDQRPLDAFHEKMLEANAEHKRYAQQRRQRREQLATLDLRQHRGRQPGVFAELHQPQFLVEPQGSDLRADLVALEPARQGLRKHDVFLRVFHRDQTTFLM